MLTLLLMIVVGGVAGYYSWTAGEGGHWFLGSLAFIAAAIAVSLPINIWVKKRMMAVYNKIQSAIAASQEVLKRKIATYQSRGIGGPRVVAELEKEQVDAIRNVIPMIDDLKPLRLWNILVGKQANLFKGQLLFQIRDYDAARPLLENAMALDPMIVCMQMVLHWKANPDETKKLDSMFNRGVGRFKYEKAKMIYALYSWILVKQNRLSEAVATLEEGKKKTDDPVLAQNWEHLANKRLNRFSNAGLGDMWYALGLETPAPVRQQQQMPFGGRPMRGGFRR